MKIKRHHFKVIESTQDYAQEHKFDLEPNICLLYTADEQTKGKGTSGRNWISPPNTNIYATFFFLIKEDKSNLLFHLPQVSTYSVAETLKSFGFEPRLKWVNDVLLDRKKVCGVLCSSDQAPESYAKEYRAVYIGIGINVNMSKEQCDTIDQPVTSLMLENNNERLNKDSILELLQTKLINNVDILFNNGFKQFSEKITNIMEFAGEEIVFDTESTEGILTNVRFKSIDEIGQLVLELPSGAARTFFCGRILRGTEISHALLKKGLFAKQNSSGYYSKTGLSSNFKI